MNDKKNFQLSNEIIIQQLDLIKNDCFNIQKNRLLNIKKYNENLDKSSVSTIEIDIDENILQKYIDYLFKKFDIKMTGEEALLSILYDLIYTKEKMEYENDKNNSNEKSLYIDIHDLQENIEIYMENIKDYKEIYIQTDFAKNKVKDGVLISIEKYKLLKNN